MTELNQSSGNGPSLPRVLTALPIPAQLTLMRSGPISSARSSAADTDSGSVTLALANRARGPNSATTSSPLRSITTTEAPLSSRRLVVARPKPDAPPVTTATESLISTRRCPLQGSQRSVTGCARTLVVDSYETTVNQS